MSVAPIPVRSVSRCLTAALCILALAFPLAAPASARVDAAFATDTRAYLSRLEKLGFSGSVMIAVGDEVLVAEGYGQARRAPAAPWTTGTVSTIGSITKQFTAAAIMRLQETGRLDVDDTLADHFDRVPDDKAGITLHQLLSHSSGISDPPVDDFDENTRQQYVATVLAAPLASVPGTTYEYANANFSLLAAIIEQTTEKSYEVALRELILAPAGLILTGYILPDYSGLTVAQGYRGEETWGTILERPMAEDGPYWALRGNGGIHSTAEEMVRWGRALLGDQVLSAASRQAMWSPHIDESNNDEGESFYGYGWVVLEPMPGVTGVTHNGGNGILFADMGIIPSLDLVVFLNTNVVSTFRVANQLLQQMGLRLQGQPYPEVPDVIATDPARLRGLAGSYALDEENRIEISVDGAALRVEPYGWDAYAAVHSMPDQDLGALAAMSERIRHIVGSYIAGDFQPIHDAYEGQVPVERLQEMHNEREARRVSENGRFRAFEVLGTCTGERYHFTPVRFDYERDSELRTYVWSREDGRLLGITTRMMDTGCRFYPVAGGRFQSWEPSTGASVPARFESGGKPALVLEREGGAVVARR